MPGKVSFEDAAGERNPRLGANRAAGQIECDDAVDQLKIFKLHAALIQHLTADRPLGGDEIVDAGAQILEHEILFGRRLAVVDLLGPAFERQLDGKRLVDGEGDVEEVEAVDAEIVDGVALGLDLVALDVAGLGDDAGHGVEGRGHRQVSELSCVSAGFRGGGRTFRGRRGRRRRPRCPYSEAGRGVQWRCAALAAGVPHQMILPRIHVVAISVAITTAKMTSSNSPACSQYRFDSAVSSAMPRPPPPTRPSTADSRTLMSQRNIAMARKAGFTCGQKPLSRIASGGAPAAVSASIGPGRTSSIASDRNFPVNPIECTAMASVPASAPGPSTATKNSAHTMACTERVATRMKRAARLRTAERVRLGAAMMATGVASATARMVPSVAVCSVSMSASCTTFGYQAQSIGHMRTNRSTVCWGAS